MPKAKKLASGNYRVLVYAGKNLAGKRQYKSFTNPNKKKAEYAASEYALKRKKENYAENLTFQKASDRYIEAKLNLLSTSTIRGYRIIQKNALSLLLNVTLGKLSASDLIQQQMNENAKKYSAKSLRNQWGFITAVMGYFNFQIDRVTLKPPEEKTFPVPTKKDAEKIMAILKEAPEIECQALFALTCSLRQSEIAGLHVSDISGSTANIHGARVLGIGHKLIYKPTNKSAAGTRQVIMPDYLAARVAELCKGKEPGDFIFNMDPDQVLKRFQRLLKKHDMPPYTMHSLRHCFAAIMHAQGIPDKYVMEMGGWASDYVLKKVYQYTFEDETEKVEKKANRYFNKAIHATRNATRKEKI